MIPFLGFFLGFQPFVQLRFKTQLNEWLEAQEEAKKRDHRKIGREQGLFALSPMVGQGLVLWMPKGGIVRNELQNFMQSELLQRGYNPVFTPHIGSIELYKTSGHFPFYKESQYPTIKADENEEYLLKPMNCPHHIQIFAAGHHSYRELPIRLAEFGTVYRYEQSGELSGMTRVRGLTQDDAHLFCTHDQVATWSWVQKRWASSCVNPRTRVMPLSSPLCS